MIGKAHGQRGILFVVSWLLLTLFISRPARAQQNPPGIAVREPSEARMQSVLAKPPSKQADGYACLRHYFTSYNFLAFYPGDFDLQLYEAL